MAELRFAAGEIIFCEYEPGDCAYIIKDGKVQISQIYEGCERVLAIIGAGEIFAEMAVLVDAPRSATAIAKTDVVLYRVDKSNLGRVLTGNPGIARKMIQSITSRSIAALHQLRMLVITDPVIKMTNLLVAYFQKLADAEQPLRISSNEEQLGRVIGLSSKECKKLLAELSRKRMIAVGNDRIECLNLGAMQQLLALYFRKQKKHE